MSGCSCWTNLLHIIKLYEAIIKGSKIFIQCQKLIMDLQCEIYSGSI